MICFTENDVFMLRERLVFVLRRHLFSVDCATERATELAQAIVEADSHHEYRACVQVAGFNEAELDQLEIACRMWRIGVARARRAAFLAAVAA